ncbi:mediator of RNA polymerase II transcription subunit 24-like [Branchiostoma lanceolatum]|uniref:mediator of RNA polymerase II transcription subunit 24-like n=1 Tax=Branchiostoma lanceolatum TaxID=7740 RepID=UPI0034544DAF
MNRAGDSGTRQGSARSINMNGRASIKSFLLRAWRERWTELQWSVNLKQAFPGGSMDQYQLAECILQQAFVGPTPNTLVLSYLRHALSSQVVSYGAFLNALTKYEDVTRPLCTRTLLDLLNCYAAHVSCLGTPDSCLLLCKSLVLTVLWLLRCVSQAVEKLKESTEYADILRVTGEVLGKLLGNGQTRALLYVGRMEEAAGWGKLEQLQATLHDSIQNLGQSGLIVRDTANSLQQAFYQLQQLPHGKALSPPGQSHGHGALNSSIAVLSFIEATLNTTSDTQLFVELLLLIERLNRIPRPRLYAQVCQACFMGLIDSAETNDELKWTAFTFLKIPQIFQRLKTFTQEGKDGREEIYQGFELLLRLQPLIDKADVKNNCDIMAQLLQECAKKDLLADAQTKKLLDKRAIDRKNLKTKQDPPPSQPNPTLILRAEPTVTNIIKTMEADYSKNQDMILGVLGHMMSGKSFELITAAAATTGKLHMFASRLIKFNEFAKHSSGEGSEYPLHVVNNCKVSLSRAVLFDISFLMLGYICVMYGTEIVCTTSAGAGNEPFFETWVGQCLPIDQKCRPVENMAHPDPARVESLLTQINSGQEIKTSLQRWQDVCTNIPFAIQEILTAWENGALSADAVQKFCDNIKRHMCCLPVCIAAWLCSYMQGLTAPEREKPLKLLKHMLSPIQGDPTMNQYNERSSLMIHIIKKISGDLLSAKSSRLSGEAREGMGGAETGRQVYTGVFSRAMQQGWVDGRGICSADNMLSIGGAPWFCHCAVKEILKCSRREDLIQSVNVALALFQLDSEPAAVALLSHVLPALLLDPSKRELLCNPRGAALARLAVQCTAMAFLTQANDRRRNGKSRSRKRGRETDREYVVSPASSGSGKEDERPSKLRILLSAPENEAQNPAMQVNLPSYSSNEAPKLAAQISNVNFKEPLNHALVRLFQLFQDVLTDSSVGPHTAFVVSFVQESVRTGEQASKAILQFMPFSMLPALLQCSSGVFSPEDITLMGDLTLPMVRKVIAKAVCYYRPI